MAPIRVQKVSNEKYRFVVAEAGNPVLIFTSKTFNMIMKGDDGYAVMSIDTYGTVVPFLIRFTNFNAAWSFYGFVLTNRCMNKDIAVNVPDMWLPLV